MSAQSAKSLPTLPTQTRPRIALVGNPNAGKTTLFNVLTGLRAKTANYPGITVDIRTGTMSVGKHDVDVVDLPGIYSVDALSPEERVAVAALHGELPGEPIPAVIVLVLDATNLARNLFLASEILELDRPTIVALNMIDAADSAGIEIDLKQLSVQLGCKVVAVSARSGRGITELRAAVEEKLVPKLPVLTEAHPDCGQGCSGCTFKSRYEWADRVCSATVKAPAVHNARTEAIDRVLTTPIVGTVTFLLLMFGVFFLIFSLADIPMSLIENGFAEVASGLESILPSAPVARPLWFGGVFALSLAVFAAGYYLSGVKWRAKSAAIAILVSAAIGLLPQDDFRSLAVDGVVGGIGGVAVFLPQICILFFFISLLEDSGYMARAAFVMERLMRFVGLPGKAFVPMLSAHACAIPGIMAARVIENWRDRLVTILVLPLLTCSARLPVYAMVAALLFRDQPLYAALVFVGAYLLGLTAALGTALLLKKSVVPGDSAPLVIELPPYRLPSFRNAMMTVLERAVVFLLNAGTVILCISVILWALATYPKLDESHLPADIAAQVETLRTKAELAKVEPEKSDTTAPPRVSAEEAAELNAEADHLIAQAGLANSFAGRLGRFVEPVFRPLGFDWKMNVGVISSFAAREVLVSTLAIMYGIGEEGAEQQTTLVETLRRQTNADGTPVFSTATCISLLVFYVLAMQCLPTQAVTRRETGSWKWALFQLTYMTSLAYIAALIAYQTLQAIGVS
ncbi:MAG: ferrous iron transporter B [Pirellulales bacterium]